MNLSKDYLYFSANTSPVLHHGVICYSQNVENSQDNSNGQENMSVASIICIHVRGKFDTSEWPWTRLSITFMRNRGQEKESMRGASGFAEMKFKLPTNAARYEGLSYLLSLENFYIKY